MRSVGGSPKSASGEAGRARSRPRPERRRLQHGGRTGRRAGRESRGLASSTAQTGPASSIYFRNLKPASASRDGVTVTTDVGVWSIQDIAVLFNIIIIFLMLFNTFVFQAGLVNLLFHKFKGTIILTAVYFALSISLHVWVMNLRWKNSNSFIWTDGLQTLFVFQRLEAVFAALQGELALCMGKQLDFPRKVQTSCVQHSRRKIFPLANQSVPIGLQCGIPSLPPTSVPPPFLPFLCTIHSP
ncbi:transmembrane protein 138 isoform X1 [Trachypithecus francoisi]|uniref:transmembrane protein 138 isoform X1 n=1 Tax=Trachypithecus francoisi TaxID=54180 RepID=UPI00141AC46E|nr:transmembrane protein 138 isoform X1 [Trachypithecus francoisi]